MIVYVVEQRQRVEGSVHWDTVVATVRSSREGAIAWCRNNLDYDSHDEANPWWFAVCSEEVDNDAFECELFTVDWEGNVLTEDLLPAYYGKARSCST